jgi:hypothetical protein
VKNHPVAIFPETPGDVLTCQDLESLLNFGNALSDESSIGRIRDSHALQLFSLAKCLDFVEKDGDLALLSLLPWALQEEVIRSSALTRRERLEKAVGSFYRFIHFFDLSFLPRSEGITQRFDSRRTTAVTFAEDSAWPRILNDNLAFIHFISCAPAADPFPTSGPTVSSTSLVSCANTPVRKIDP